MLVGQFCFVWPRPRELFRHLLSTSSASKRGTVPRRVCEFAKELARQICGWCTDTSGYDANMSDLRGSGFAVADIRLSSDQCDHIVASLPSAREHRGGLRGLLYHPTVLQLLRHPQLAKCLRLFTGRELVAVACDLDNSAEPCDRVGEWHQDRVVSVRERMDISGYGPWTLKVGVPYVEPPSAVLAQMLVVRVYLEAEVGDSYALHVIPGSHEGGKLTPEVIDSLVSAGVAVAPEVGKGSFLLARPLLLHSTRQSAGESSVRLLRFVFAPTEAISPLQWHSVVHLHRAA